MGKRVRAFGLGMLATVACLTLVQASQVFAGRNWHVVVPGEVYRCAQPRSSNLLDEARQYQIRTVVNLRGTAQLIDDPRNGWYRDEVLATHGLQISQEDVTLSARQLPPPSELRRLVEVFDQSQKPLLIHCKQGADRTGLASALYQLLYTESTLFQARNELRLWRGHFGIGPTAPMDEFFDRYESWLAAQQKAHAPELLRYWLLQVYTPGKAKSQLVWTHAPSRISHGEHHLFQLRATNLSTDVWEFQPGNHSGVHLQWMVSDGQRLPIHFGQSGLFRRSVAPGESIELTIDVPPMAKAGTYYLGVELIDGVSASIPGRQNSFVKFGDRSLTHPFEVN